MATDFKAWIADQRLAFERAAEPFVRDEGHAVPLAPDLALPRLPVRAGVIANARSHRNRLGLSAERWDGVLYAAPTSKAELAATLRDYAARGIDLLIVNGGDGTVRDVLSTAADVFARTPRIAVVPTGKTNALALDLGIPADWTVTDALDAARAGRFTQRSPVEITRDGASGTLRGFLFGAGGFVRATDLAQRTHKAGAFNGIAVGLSLGWSILQTVFGRADNEWRTGEPMRVRTAEGAAIDRNLYLLLASTLERLPLGLKPFGPERAGLKLLAVDAPPRNLLLHAPMLLAGSQSRSLRDAGFHHLDTVGLNVTLDGGFILDGERYDGGALTIRRGEPIAFATP